MKRIILPNLKKLLPVLLLLALVLSFWAAAASALSAEKSMGKARLEESLHRAAASCYGAEGFYPATLQELTSRFGITVDESRYTVYYDVFASNLMPEIIVLEN
ncbi:MAG: hypothetical protein HUJ80_06940 [Firmicutes bacterium]|nr:hypothetical protein [Bacillota bacterium]